MPQILIINSNTPELDDMGELMRQEVQAIQPDIDTGVAHPYAGVVTNDALEAADGFIFTGSLEEWSVHAHDAKPLRQLMHRAFDSGKPVYGSCNGMQLAAVVLGGTVGPSPYGVEVGVASDIRLTPRGRQHPLLRGRRDGFSAACIHRDEVRDLPDGAQLLAGNAHTRVQAFAYEQQGVRFWGVQYHPEYTLDYIAQCVEYAEISDVFDTHDLRAATHDPDAAGRIGANLADLPDRVRRCELENWLRLFY